MFRRPGTEKALVVPLQDLPLPAPQTTSSGSDKVQMLMPRMCRLPGSTSRRSSVLVLINLLHRLQKLWREGFNEGS